MLKELNFQKNYHFVFNFSQCSASVASFKSVMRSITTAAKGGNWMNEVLTCSSGTASVGCYIKDAPLSSKLVLMWLASLASSMPSLTTNLHKQFSPPPESLVSSDFFHRSLHIDINNLNQKIKNYMSRIPGHGS